MKHNQIVSLARYAPDLRVKRPAQTIDREPYEVAPGDLYPAMLRHCLEMRRRLETGELLHPDDYRYLESLNPYKKEHLEAAVGWDATRLSPDQVSSGFLPMRDHILGLFRMWFTRLLKNAIVDQATGTGLYLRITNDPRFRSYPRISWMQNGSGL